MKQYAFGADVGGTTIKMGLFSTTGDLIEKWEIPTDTSDNGSHILRDIADSVEQHREAHAIARDQIEGVGIGVPGAVDKDGVVNKCVNLGWGVVPVERDLSELSGFRVKAGNDANVAALGEYWMGSGKGYDSICMVTLGTGIGGGLIVDGHIIVGAHGAAGEIGHIIVNPHETERCTCGHYGCIEQYASATGVVRVARRMMEKGDGKSTLYQRAGGLTAKDVFDLAKDGDALAVAVVDRVCELLGKTLGKVACVFNPSAFILGGGVSKAGQILVEKSTPAFVASTFHASRDTDIVLASLGNDAGIYGAVRMLL